MQNRQKQGRDVVERVLKLKTRWHFCVALASYAVKDILVAERREPFGLLPDVEKPEGLRPTATSDFFRRKTSLAA
jgi:hypothetical protein